MARRSSLVVGALGLCVLMGANQLRVVVAHIERPGLYPDDAPALLELRTLVPSGSTVTMTSDKRVRGVINGFAAYALDHAIVWGHVRTGYAESRAGDSGAIGAYGLLHAFEDPLLWGYTYPPIWRGGSYALYRRPPETQKHLRLLNVLESGEVLVVPVNAESSEAETDTGSHTLRLMVATLAPATVEVNDAPISLMPGRRIITLHPAPSQDVAIRHIGAAPLLVETATWLTHTVPGGQMSVASNHNVRAPIPEMTVQPMTNSAIVQASAVASGAVITTTLETLLSEAGPVRAALDIWDVERGIQYGWYGLLIVPDSEVQRFSMVLSLADGQMQCVSAGGETPIGAYFVGLKPGRYTARLSLAAGTQMINEPIDLFGFEITSDRAIAGVWVREKQLQAGSVINPATISVTRIGRDIALLGYTIMPPRLRAGGAADLILWWRSLNDNLDERSVLIHLIDAAGNKYAQADGPPAEGVLPTSRWRAGLTVVDARQFRLPADLPPGDYTLLVGMYRWPSLERLPTVQNNTLLPGAVIRIPVRIEA
ncbi:hypothetical protein [Roseiflexus castenholzii]|uniref:hypothetical protein n=1 Tax=Roseiflexus castenholzii TaxID=120962 RepID=UPI0000E7D779|nr:hypothetical protein [Roseiflexus castenholzii]